MGSNLPSCGQIDFWLLTLQNNTSTQGGAGTYLEVMTSEVVTWGSGDEGNMATLKSGEEGNW